METDDLVDAKFKTNVHLPLSFYSLGAGSLCFLASRRRPLSRHFPPIEALYEAP